MIKIISGFTEKGGSTMAFINLTNALNLAGFDCVFYGPHDWHLDKCRSAKTNTLTLDKDDTIIVHFLGLEERPNVKNVILSCHEKNLFMVGKIKKFWDKVVFLNEKHREYHKDYTGDFTIIPNLKEDLKISDKTNLDKVAGIIGSFDENKQVHISIIRGLRDGCEKILLFGTPSQDIGYYQNFIKPLLSDKVVEMGFVNNKQSIYDMIGRVYHSSISEVATLVKDECYTTGTKFFGNDATDTPVSTLTNEEIINQWVKLLIL